MSESFDLKSYVMSFLQNRGCLVEERGRMLLAALDSDTAREIGTPEYVQLLFEKHNGAEVPESYLHVQFGSIILERINESVRKRGNAMCVSMNDLYLKKERLSEELTKQFQFVKIKPVWEGSKPDRHEYLLATFRYRAASDDSREGLVDAIVSCQTLASPRDMKEPLERLMTMYDPDSGSARTFGLSAVGVPNRIESVLRKAAKVCEEQVRRELAEFCSSMSRRRERDRKRVEEYYGSMRTEIESFIKRRMLSSEDAKRQREKITAIERELTAKLDDLEEKYAVKVSLNIVSSALIAVPTLVNRVKLLKGNAEGEIECVWNSVTKAFDPLACANCGSGTMTVCACEAWHISCLRCSSPCAQCGRAWCRKCAASCPKCGVAIVVS